MAPARIVRQAEHGDIDLAFHTSDDLPSGPRRRVLFAERMFGLAARGHPRMKQCPTLAQFCKLEHVTVAGWRRISWVVARAHRVPSDTSQRRPDPNLERPYAKNCRCYGMLAAVAAKLPMAA
ncbi:hypothetical protein [Paraburkholderia phymatum]|uniref:hypothetical protein n=1 Tax=Paraburkholderia phymatum TaxID=148447 RepID=UPI003F750F5A